MVLYWPSVITTGTERQDGQEVSVKLIAKIQPQISRNFSYVLLVIREKKTSLSHVLHDLVATDLFLKISIPQTVLLTEKILAARRGKLADQRSLFGVVWQAAIVYLKTYINPTLSRD